MRIYIHKETKSLMTEKDYKMLSTKQQKEMTIYKQSLAYGSDTKNKKTLD